MMDGCDDGVTFPLQELVVESKITRISNFHMVGFVEL